MKTLIHILSVIAILTLVAVPSHAGDGINGDKELQKKLSDVLTAWGKIKPGMTRAQLTNDFILTSPWGPWMVSPHAGRFGEHGGFVEHEMFCYRSCDLILIDVDFKPSTSKDARLTDIIVKISMPYLEWPATD